LRCKVCFQKLERVDDAEEFKEEPEVSFHVEEVKGAEEDEDDDLASLECNAVPEENHNKAKAAEAAAAAADAKAAKVAEANRRAERRRKQDLAIMLGFNNNLLPTDAAGEPLEDTRQKLVCVSLSLCELRCALVSSLWDVLSEGSTHWTMESRDSLLTLVPILARYLSRGFTVLASKYRNFEELVESEGKQWRSACKLKSPGFWHKYFTMGEETRDALQAKLRTHIGSIVYALTKARSGRVVGSAHSHAQHLPTLVCTNASHIVHNDITFMCFILHPLCAQN
jgi:hypothetical protein